MAKSQRKFINYLKTSGLTSTYSLHIFAGGVAFLGIIMIYTTSTLSEIQTVVAHSPDIEMVDEVNQRLLTVAVMFFLSFFMFLLSTVFYMVVLGQRVGGPVVAICDYIRSLKAGNYDAPRALRKKDELTAIMTELHDLAEVLKKNQPSGPTP